MHTFIIALWVTTLGSLKVGPWDSSPLRRILLSMLSLLSPIQYVYMIVHYIRAYRQYKVRAWKQFNIKKIRYKKE